MPGRAWRQAAALDAIFAFAWRDIHMRARHMALIYVGQEVKT